MSDDTTDTNDFLPAGAEVDLTNCDREPIHIPGLIQPFGFLLAADGDEVVQRCSANAPDFLDLPADRILGRDITEILGRPAMHALRGQFQTMGEGDALERVFGLSVPCADGRFDFAVHKSSGLRIFEAQPTRETQLDPAGAVSRMTARLSKMNDIGSLASAAARHLRALTGFDRVMVYSFAEDGSGEVLAEAARSDLESYLGLHYPASDIPKQARELYKRNLLRIIPDVAAASAPILPDASFEGAPIDLSLSVLRAVSPIHIEYLQNIGVDASMSVSIMRGDDLWGLFACHHMSPHPVPFDVRTAAELFGQVFSYMLETRAQAEMTRHERRAQAIHTRMMQRMARDAEAMDVITQSMDEMSDLLNADGVAMRLDGQVVLHGAAPSEQQVEKLVRFLGESGIEGAFVTDALPAAYPAAEAFDAEICGLLAIPLSRTREDYLMFFRPEAARTVNWAGDPTKPAVSGPEGARLSPRKSFELWKETVRGRSVAWSEHDQVIAETLRVSLLEIVLQLANTSARTRKEAQQRQELLIAELNHRVRNILSLIRGLIGQSRDSAGNVDELVEVIGDRIQALARAHDQLTQASWGPRPLADLIRSEAQAYFGEKSSRVLLSGPGVLITPEAFSALALVFHELVTNSAKYGALADSSGEVRVTWSVGDSGALDLKWVEAGGPPVKPPTRKGFGTTIMERVVPTDLRGESEIEFALSGVRAHFVIPSAHIAGQIHDDDEVSAAPDLPAGASRPDLGRTLLVEDNLIIALDAEDLLRKLGAKTVDAVGSVREALRLIEESPPDFAVLDVNLGSETSLKVADALKARGTPFLFATGYGEQAKLEGHENAPIVTKPYSEDSVEAALTRLLMDSADGD